MVRIVVVLLAAVLAGCTTTSTVQQQHAPVPGRAYALAFENNAGDDLTGIASLVSIIQRRLSAAGLLGSGAAQGGRLEVELTHYYVRSYAARSIAGILAGRDKIVSQVTVLDAGGTQVGRFEVETTNLSAWGSGEGLMEQHADEIVGRLQP